MKLATLSLSVLVATAAYAQGEVKSVEAVGEAAIVGTGPDAELTAKESAKKAALRNAVEQVAGTLISADTLTQNSQLISDRVFANSQGYVKKFSAPKYETAGGVVKATLTAEVSTAGLDKDLQAVQALVKSLGNRKMVILLNEKAADPKGVIVDSGVMTEVLTNAFKQDGFTIIDPAFLAGKVRVGAGVTMGAAEAKEIANLTKADYIVYGQVNFAYQDPNQGMMKLSNFYPVTGEYALTVFESHSGTQIGTHAGTFDMGSLKATGKSPTIGYARTSHYLAQAEAPGVVGRFRKIVYDYLSSNRQNGTRLVLEVLGLPDVGAADDFREVIQGRKGVQDVSDASYGDGKANFDVVYVGTVAEFAKEFRNTKFQTKKVTVSGRQQNRVELTVAK